MPGKTSINYLFPPDKINDLPTWRFILHFDAPPEMPDRALPDAIAILKTLEWKIIQFPFPLDELEVNSETNSLDIPIEVPEDRRYQPESLKDYESDFWKIFGHVQEAGFGELFYQALDWENEEDR